MPNIVAPELDAYLYGLLPPSNPVLLEMERQARERDIPIVGPAVARLFGMLVQLTGARRVFELGSAIGYSTLWWAEAVGREGEVYYTDSNAGNLREAKGYFQRAALDQRIHQLQGDAIASLQQTSGEFDIIFCDLDKHQYPDALRAALPRIRPGGLLVADNVLWSGRVAHPDDSAATRGIIEFNRMIYAEPTLFPVILPLRDGVAVCRKAAV